MAQKMKLNIEDLKVQSFVTSLKNEQKDTLKGGKPPVPESQGTLCESDFCSYRNLCW